ncbi:MAG: FAD-binding protein [Caldilinea sp. CFX5]|nr:FAD-binding protein [Caldilinea sp. CFX5]
MTTHRQNWAGNVPYGAAHYHSPATLDELQALVRAADKVRVIGGRHSFTPLTDSTGTILSLANLDKTVTIDHQRRTATVNANITYRELCPQLHRAGYALHNMASLDHITVIGAAMTATHGSGDAHGNLATAISGLEMVTATGDLVTLSRDKDGDTFNGAVVTLGALGVVTKVTLDLLPAFALQQDIYEKLPMTEVYANFDAIMTTGYSVSLFPDWQQDWVNSVWVKQQVPADRPAVVPTTFFGATLRASARPVEEDADRYSTPISTPGPWHERLPHFVFHDAEREGNELQSEYFVARHQAVAAMQAVAQFRQQLAPIIGVTEIRSVAADQLWLSTAYGQETIGIHFNWQKKGAAVQQFLPSLEAALAPFQPRPHWGKLFNLTPAQVQARYPRLADFQALAHDYDPQGKFRNAFVERYLFAA